MANTYLPNNNKNDYWVRDYKDGKLTHYLNNVGYDVYANDSLGRWNAANSAYTAQNGGVASTGTVNSPTGYDQYVNILEDKYNNSKQAAQGQIDAAVNTLKSGIGTANSTYDNANRAAYLNLMNTEKNLAQQLAAAGLGKTGVSESTRLANNVNYSNSINSNEQARNQALQDIYNQIAQTQAAGAVTLADIDRELANNQANAYLSSLQADRDQMNSDRSYQQAQRQYDDSQLWNAVSLLQDLGVSGNTLIYYLKQLGFNVNSNDLNLYNAQRNKDLKNLNK